MSKDKKKSTYRDNILVRGEEARVVRKIASIIIIALILIILIGGISAYMYIKAALKPVNPENDKVITVEIPLGSSTADIGGILEESDIIKDGRIFRIYTKIKNQSDFQAGKYDLTQAMTMDEIMEIMKSGRLLKEPLHKVTIPEGKTIEEIAGIYEEKLGIKKKEFIKQANNPKYVNQLLEKYSDILSDEILNPEIKSPLEGYLFAATYEFYEEEDLTPKVIIEMMLDKTKEVVGQYVDKINHKEMTIHEAVTMSSLVEKEARNEDQRRKIAGIFYNRLDEGMMLQTDPTVLYALGKHKDKVYLKDLQVDSPYNTYQVLGIPVGPISNFNENSLQAILDPEDTDFLYFLHDGKGKIYYAKTHDEHLRLKEEHIN